MHLPGNASTRECIYQVTHLLRNASTRECICQVTHLLRNASTKHKFFRETSLLGRKYPPGDKRCFHLFPSEVFSLTSHFLKGSWDSAELFSDIWMCSSSLTFCKNMSCLCFWKVVITIKCIFIDICFRRYQCWCRNADQGFLGCCILVDQQC